MSTSPSGSGARGDEAVDIVLDVEKATETKCDGTKGLEAE